jgi:NitT/TauT family transport system substrate-binding protein
MKVTSRTRSCAALVAGLLALASLAACGDDDSDSSEAEGTGGDSSELQKITFLSPGPPALESLQVVVPDELGFFEEEGIDFEFQNAGEELNPYALVSQNRGDIAQGDAFEFLPLVEEGADLKLFMDFFKGLSNGLVVRGGSDITSTEDLEGKTIGFADAESEQYAVAALQAVGISKSDVRFVKTGEGATAALQVTDGTIDAYSGNVTEFAVMEAAEVEVENIETPNSPPPAGVLFVARTSSLENDRDVYAGFARAVIKGFYAAGKDPEMVEHILRDSYPQDWTTGEENTRAFMNLLIEHIAVDESGYGGVVKSEWDATVNQLVESGELQEAIPFDDYFVDVTDEANDWDTAQVEAAIKKYRDDNM